MIPALPALHRRGMVLGGLGLALAGWLNTRQAHAQATIQANPQAPGPATLAPLFPDGASVTIAGPEGGELDIWADGLLAALGRFLPTSPPMRRILAGGLDGITGTNQFAAQAQPDGSAALLAPGTALLAWLFADPRVRSNLGRCVPLLAGFHPTLLAGRVDPTSLARGQKLRIGIAGPDGPEMAALLGLERLGLVPVPVPGLVDFTLTQAAFSQHTVDVMLLRGTSVAATLAASSDARPICVLGTPDATGALLRDPALPDVPHLGELLGGMPDDPLSAGWRVAAVAAQQAFNLMLPPLTPATMVALWQLAVEQAVASPDIRTMAAAQAVRLQANPGTLAGDPAALTALRTWFAAYRRK